MPPPSVDNWPILPELAVFRTATFNQRCILFTHFREDPRLAVGACPGLSAEWITMHALWPNQKPADRMTAMDKLSVWQDAAAYAGAFNSTRGGYAYKVGEVMKLESSEIPFSSADPVRRSSDVCTFFDPTNKYCIITAYLDGVNINHMCAGFCTTNGRIFKSKTLLMFDPNFGEFTVELTPTKMRAFMAAWIAQFGSYVSGRSGTATALKLVKLEVIRLENVVGKRGRSGAVSGR